MGAVVNVSGENIPTHVLCTDHAWVNVGYPSKRWLVKEEGEKWWVELGGRYGWGGKENIPTQLHIQHTMTTILEAQSTHTHTWLNTGIRGWSVAH